MLAASDTGTAIREWIVGVGSVIAAVVALYLGVWRERWRRPRLELHLDKSSDPDLVTLTTPRFALGAPPPRSRLPNRRGVQHSHDDAQRPPGWTCSGDNLGDTSCVMRSGNSFDVVQWAPTSVPS